MTVLTISLSYFVYDTLCCLLIEADLASFIHHVCSILGISVGVFQAKVPLRG